jgi:hypothetical protein
MTEQMPGELIYEYTIQSTGATSYGVPPLDALLSGVAEVELFEQIRGGQRSGQLWIRGGVRVNTPVGARVRSPRPQPVAD